MSDPNRIGARVPGPTLLRLIHQQRFEDALNHLQERPQDALYKDGVGDTALCALCLFSRPSDVALELVKEIVGSFPNLVNVPRNGGLTPMHAAAMVCQTSKEAQRLLTLIHANPQAISCQTPRNVHAYAPFHYACRGNAPMTVLKAMLQVDPSLATLEILQISDTETYGYPLFMLWAAMKGLESPEDWPKMELLLRAATWSPLEDPENYEPADVPSDPQNRFDVLRAACMVNPCPRDYIELLLQRYPNRLAWADPCGFLPLHHAILSSDKKWPAHTGLLLKAMLERYPAAASCPFGKANGSSTLGNSSSLLPLHVSIADSEITWHKGGVKDLVFAYPEALCTPDPRTRLIPALSSAPLAIQSRLHLSTTYELLRLSPELFQNCTSNEPSIDNAMWPFD